LATIDTTKYPMGSPLQVMEYGLQMRVELTVQLDFWAALVDGTGLCRTWKGTTKVDRPVKDGTREEPCGACGGTGHAPSDQVPLYRASE
jgi:hypothetical protein